MRRMLVLIAALLSVGLVSHAAAAAGDPLAWPQVTNTAKPWAYWWWMGSAVNEADLSRELRRYAEAGMGGVHIIPIYGAKGYEKQYVQYLSPRWMALMRHAVEEARRLGMDVDMTLGTGWCFGGPQIPDRDANARMVVKTARVGAGERIKETFDRAATQALMAFSESGQAVDLTAKIGADGKVDWTAPAGKWVVHAISQRPSGQRVKRAGPGGTGWMLNPFYPQAIRDFLPPFTQAFAAYDGPRPRAVYHDSYEYQSNWSPDFFEQFQKRRGYRLQDHLPALLDEDKDSDRTGRVKSDYRQTISDLMVEAFMPAWVNWAHERGMIARDEAHGSPGNLLDLYAAADVPETEMFNKDRNPLVAKFASSAAHVTGKRLTSAETGTWMAEHFTETLAQMKRLVDEMFVSGVNHIFYHGTCYSPDEAAWPGWVFYASTEMNPRNAIWHDVGTLNAYIARCQSVLQSGEPDNDVLLYWPVHDLWHAQKGLVQTLTVHRTDWLMDQPAGRAAKALWEGGYGFDYASDRQLNRASVAEGRIHLGDGRYGVIVVPTCAHMPVETMAKLVELSNAGARVVFEGKVPADVPGLGDLDARRQKLRGMTDALHPGESIFIGDLSAGLAWAMGEHREMLPDPDLRVIRRRWEQGRQYFIVNSGERSIDCRMPLDGAGDAVLMMDPMTGRTGLAEVAQKAVHLRLVAGESVILRTLATRPGNAPVWDDQRFEGKPVELSGEWRVKFISGGPELPGEFVTRKLASWTELGDERAKAFAGTVVYSVSFDGPPGGRCMLDLGKVCESARVRVNGKEIGTLIMPPYRVELEGLRDKGNVLEVEVTSTSANRIRDLDRRGVKWHNFNDIGFVNMDYKPFDASKWPLRDSGLLGPVRLIAEK